jgi:iron complex outermembrane receptor protein
VGGRFSASYINQFADGTIGVALGYAHIESPSQFERFNSWGYTTFDGNNATYGAPNGSGGYTVRPEYAAAQGKFVIGGAKPFVQSNELTRTGVVGTLEYRPSDNLTSILDLYYTKFKEEQILRGIELPLAWGDAILQPGYTVAGNSITAGTWGAVKGVVRNDYIERNAEIFAGGWNTKYTTGEWTLVGDASYSRVNRQDFYVETYAGTSRGGGNGPYDTMGFTTQDNGITTFTSQLDYADYNLIKLTSPKGWADGAPPTSVPGGQDGYLSNPKIEDELFALRGSAAHAFEGAVKSVEVGVNYTGHTKSYRPNEFFLAATANVNDPAHNTSVVVPPAYRLGTTSLAYLGIPGMVSFDTMGLINNNVLTRLANPSANITLNSWSIDEKVLTGWVRADFDTEVRYGTLTGNAGLQVVYTDQSSDGRLNLVGGISGGTPVTDGTEFTELLPA